MFVEKRYFSAAPFRDEINFYKFPSFWTLQILGWSAYGFHRWLINPDFFNNKFIYLLVGFALTSLVRPFYRELWHRNRSLYFILPFLVLFSVVGGVVYVLVSRLILVLLGISVYANQSFFQHLFEAFQNSFLHNKTFVFFSWGALYFGIKYWRDSLALRERSFKAEITARDAQLEMLRYQINPHFLFNSLNSIYALVGTNPEGAEKMIERLSALLRYSLSNDEVFRSALGEEFEIARKYLEIEKIRFEESLEIEQALEASIKEFAVPSLILHPLIENAVKYGMRTSEMPLRVRLSAKKVGDKIYVEIANTGHLVDKKSRKIFDDVSGDEGTGIGLQNVRRRLEAVFPGKHDFRVFESDGWVQATIEISTNETKFGSKEMESVNR